MMRKTALWAVFLAMAITPAAIATTTLSLEGAYVEARSAQVFIGGCVWNSEAVTIGREAITVSYTHLTLPTIYSV